METNKVIQGDCLDILKTLPENSVYSIVTDPPYELGFMGKSWDNTGIANNPEMWKECLRVLKPGGYLLSFGGTRTYHRMACAIEDAGFEVRDMIEWCYGSGFPKSLNIGKAVDKLQGNEREEIEGGQVASTLGSNTMDGGQANPNYRYTKGTSDWEGWGTALKPAHEPICLARKPLAEKSVALNVLKYGTGGINIDESRVGTEIITQRLATVEGGKAIGGKGVGIKQKATGETTTTIGRFPANLCWSCDCDNNYLTGNALFDILSDISNQIKLCQSNNSNSIALNVEQKKHQQDTTSEERKLCFAVENVDTLILEKILGKTLEVIFSVDTECSVEMLEKSMSTSLSISLSGNEKIEEYQKVLKFITLTATNLITELKTCNLSQSQIIGNFITKVISGIREQSRVKSHSPECWVRECFPESKGGAFPKTHGSSGFVSPEEKESRLEMNDSGNASRFFKSIIYQAKSSKSERNKGLDSIVLVDILRVWNENNTTKEEKLIRLMVTGISPQKVIAESGVQLKNANEWNTCLFGKHLMEKYQEDIKSITKTETNSITTSQTLNWLTHLLTNEYTVVANLEMENGGNLVENVKNSNTLIITINESMALALGVKDVVSGMQLKINVKEGSNIHSTVKPIALMEYLIKMVTPKGGIVLDPFAGSGSTLVAAKQNGYQYIGIEMTPEYIPIIEARLTPTEHSS